VASQAPATLPTTSAEESTQQATQAEQVCGEKARYAIRVFKRRMVAQDGLLTNAFERAAHLEAVSVKTHSPAVSTAIKDILEAISDLKANRDKLNKSFNVLLYETQTQVCTSRVVTKQGQLTDVNQMHAPVSASVPAPVRIRGSSVSCQTDMVPPPVTRAMATQTPCWWDLDSPGPHRAGRREVSEEPTNAAGSKEKKQKEQPRDPDLPNTRWSKEENGKGWIKQPAQKY